jgi:protein ImuB
LPLEALHRSCESARSSAVFEEREGVRRVLLADRAAEKRGITAGLSVNAALALEPTLELLLRDPGQETRVLESLAARAERFTSLVSLEVPDGLLLEIAGSLKLFGGREALRRRIETGFARSGFTACLAITPTPLASTWLARSGRAAAVLHPEYLVGALGSLPLQCLRWPATVCESLNGMGITAVGECLRLPREGFVRRFGAGRLLQLDRALGRLPDPRANYRAPERFCQEYELDEPQDDRERLLAVCLRLLEALERFLIERQMIVQKLLFGFFHWQGPATRLVLGSLEPGSSAGHWYELLAMEFERRVLPSPVIMIRLESGRTQACAAATDALPFGRVVERSQPVVSATRLMERLAARMGDDCVHGVAAVAEHRPQRAWRVVRATGHRFPTDNLPGNGGGARRPLWLLAEPLALSVEGEVPQYQGPLRFENGPERLETGWWDGEDIARDYFTAVNPKGLHLWVYRSRARDAGWYLHGIFA